MSPASWHEDGFGMLEMIAAMAIMLVVMSMGLNASGSLLGVETQAVGKGQATTQAVAAVNELRQEIVSANILFDPAGDHDAHGTNYAGSNPDGTAMAPGWSLRIYTQLNGNPICVQWRLLDTGALQTRTWSDLWQTNGIVHPWTTLAASVVNTPGSPPFALNYNANYGGTSSRLVNVNLYLSSGAGAHTSSVLLESSIAGRNAEYYPASSANCYPLPSS